MKQLISKMLIISMASVALVFLFGAGINTQKTKIAFASGTNITSTALGYWAWNDAVGWMDFYDTNNIVVDKSGMTGYASSSIGDISLDCATTRSGSICGAQNGNYRVLNDGNGNLTGWGWNDRIGWISFCGGQSSSGCPGSISYQVQINPNTGVFGGNGYGWAWNDIVGWISFNCAEQLQVACGTYSYKVITTWIATSTVSTLDSTTYDTGVSRGAQINSVKWKGSQPAGTSVGIQFAGSATSSGPWNYAGPSGSNSYYTPAFNTQQKVDYILHNNQRYFRYRLTLYSDQAQRSTPQVDDVIINWSP